MSSILQPWHILLVALCGLVNQRQQQIIEFQNSQIEALLKQLGKKRMLLDDDQRRLLAVKAHAIGRKALREITTIFRAGRRETWDFSVRVLVTPLVNDLPDFRQLDIKMTMSTCQTETAFRSSTTIVSVN